MKLPVACETGVTKVLKNSDDVNSWKISAKELIFNKVTVMSPRLEISF